MLRMGGLHRMPYSVVGLLLTALIAARPGAARAAVVGGSCEFGCGTTFGTTCCSGVCAATQTDRNNCGSCGHACASGQSCCAGVCRSTATDEQNCGTCSNACAT